MIIRWLLSFCLILICCVSNYGQQTPQSGNVYARLRAVAALKNLTDQIAAADEPTLRISLRLRLATFLWASKDKEIAKNAEEIIVSALADFQEHRNEILSFYVKSFRTEISALLRVNAPSSAARLIKQYELEESAEADRFRDAYAMLDVKDGVTPAIEKMSHALATGQDPGLTLLFFLDRIEKEFPAELPRLLTNVLAIEEAKPGTYSTRTLFWLGRFYLPNVRLFLAH